MQNNFIGNFFSLLAIRGVTLVTGWLQQGWNQLSQKLREWTVLVSKLSELEFELRKDIERSRIAWRTLKSEKVERTQVNWFFFHFQGAKASVAVFLLVGVIPLLFGILLEVVVLMPVRVPLTQSPVFFLWQDWALGAMYTKITIALTFMGPDWWLKAAIEQLYQVTFHTFLTKLMLYCISLHFRSTLIKFL
jgi:hypothetical protein